jgi:hypothetical protein
MTNTFKIGKVLADNTAKIICKVEFDPNYAINKDTSIEFKTNYASNNVAVNATAATNKTTVSQSIKNVTAEKSSITITKFTNDKGLFGWKGKVFVTVSDNLVGKTIQIRYVSPKKHTVTMQFLDNTNNAADKLFVGWSGAALGGTYVNNTNDKTLLTSVVPTSTKFVLIVDGDDHNGATSDIYLTFEGLEQKGNVIIASSDKKLDAAIDPVAQTFYVNPKEYPNGLFVSKADVYFSQKPETGSNNPAWIYLTKTVNGYPESTNYITNSRVELPYASVNLPTGTSIAPIPAATTFTFSDPIYLEAGEYAIVVGSDNAKYRVFVSELGSVDLATSKLISTNPDGNVGSFFMSQNARTWTADQGKDMMFNLHKCVFKTDPIDVEIPLIKDSDTIISDAISVTSPNKAIPGTTLNYYSKLTTSYIPINNNTNVKLAGRTTVGTTPTVKYTLSSASADLSPIIQKDKIAVKYIQNAINTKLDLQIDETDPYEGEAKFKYVTKKVVLADGFDATGIRVLLDVNRLHGTSIEVYIKAVAGEDFSKFEGHYYQQVPLNGDITYSSTDDEFVINEFKLNNLSYRSGNVSYTSFKTFIIKVVMYSDNPVNFPRVKNLRAIATS